MTIWAYDSSRKLGARRALGDISNLQNRDSQKGAREGQVQKGKIESRTVDVTKPDDEVGNRHRLSATYATTGY